MPSLVESVDRFLVHPLLWGILSLIALAIALSGRLSAQGADWIVGVAVIMTTFAVYRSAFRTDIVLRLLVTAGLGFLLASLGVTLARWLSSKQVKSEQAIGSNQTREGAVPASSARETVPNLSKEDVRSQSFHSPKRSANNLIGAAPNHENQASSSDPTKMTNVVGGSINISGNARVDSAQVTNNFGPPSPRPLVITTKQMLAVTSGSSAFSGEEVGLSWELGPDDTELFAANLEAALQSAGLIVRKEPAMFVLMDNMKPPPPGLTFSFHDKGEQLMSAIANSLHASGFPVPPHGFPAFRSISQDQSRALTIYIGRAQITEAPVSR